MSKPFLLILVLILYSGKYILAQEIKCNVVVNSDLIQGTNKSVFNTLQKSINEFVNNHNWTNQVFNPEERIECNLTFTIKDFSGTDFSGTLQIQSRRPVFNSSYHAPLFNNMDQNIQFSYTEYDALEFNEATFSSNLTSLLAYYVYIILGMDYDTYSMMGGNDYLKKAEIIVSNAQNASEKGWKPTDGVNNKNRFWLIENMLDEKYSPIREFLYKYHRLGLDKMADNPSDGRYEIEEDLTLLQQVYQAKPDPYMLYLQIIFDAKCDEFINIFSEAPLDEKTSMGTLLKEIDPANLAKYQKMMQ